MKVYRFVIAVFFIFFTGCGNNSSSSSNENMVGSVLQRHPEHVKNILFAHGYHDNKLAWNTFAAYIKNDPNYSKRWHIYRTSVDRSGSIVNRAAELAQYIDSLNIDDDSMLVVAHSMGGLDVHYIISEGHKMGIIGATNNIFYIAAKKIHKLYTLATPHRGNMFAGNDLNDAVHDMGIDNMRAFNAKYPYNTFSIDGRKIPMLAFRFRCSETLHSDGSGSRYPDGYSDGTVATKRQMMFGAPHTQTIFQGRHTTKPPNVCRTDKIETTLSDTILKGILDNRHYYTDSYDIVLYEKRNCEGEESGFFSSHYSNGDYKCGNNKHCDNDKTASVLIYPGVRSNMVLRLYDNSKGDGTDDWTRIHIGQTTLKEPFCIDDLEHQTYQDEKDRNITVTHYHNNGLDGKVSLLKVSHNSSQYGPIDIVAYEDGYCKGDIVAFYNSRKERNDRWGTGSLNNDKVRSLLLYPHTSGDVTITLYNSPDRKKEDGYTVIQLSGSSLKKSICIGNLDKTHTYTAGHTTIKKTYHAHTNFCWIDCGVSGHVSDIHIEP